jgi:hypothetical protein
MIYKNKNNNNNNNNTMGYNKIKRELGNLNLK